MKEHKIYPTGFLYTTPSFILGAGSVLNIFGDYFEYNSSESGFEADEKAIKNDFKLIGEDINKAIEQIRRENNLMLSE
jgi:hypothetical protein